MFVDMDIFHSKYCGKRKSVEDVVPERNNSVETLRVIFNGFSVVSVVHVCKFIKISDRL